MNAQNLALAHGLVDDAYLQQGGAALRTREGLVRSLLSQRCLPLHGWDDVTIELLLSQLSMMDSNNFVGSVGAGEREARVFSSLVRARHYGFGHGIGRSGDIAAVQPKAAGSSLIYALTNKLVLHAIRLCGISLTQAALVVPLATGMSITLTLLALKQSGLRPPQAKYVIWPRIDQKSAFKCILTAGLEPIIIENVFEATQTTTTTTSNTATKIGAAAVENTNENDCGSNCTTTTSTATTTLATSYELRTDLAMIQSTIERLGADNVLCVFTTTSCFAPRAIDKVVEVAQLCKALGVGHIINNAYGLQSSKSCHELNEACRLGRVDAWISSTDKNFLVPVGGAIIAGPASSTSFIETVSKAYPGRASIAPILDLFITFLSMGQNGLKSLLQQRKGVYTKLLQEMQKLAIETGEKLLSSPHNPISIAMSVDICITTSPKTLISKKIADLKESPSEMTASDVGDAVKTLESGDASEAAASTPIETDDIAGAGGGGGGAKLSRKDSVGESIISTATVSTSSRSGGGKGGSSSSHHNSLSGPTYLGSMLFSRGVSGTRVIPQGEKRKIDKYSFMGYGASHDAYPHTYITAAAAMGMTLEDVDVFIEKLRKTIAEYKREQGKSSRKREEEEG